MLKPRLKVPNGWKPRPYQESLWRYLWNGGRRADVVAHRRWGKDEMALNWAAVSVLRKPATYWHMLPEQAQARKAIWNAVNPHTGRKRIDEAFPQAMRKRTRDDEMLIEFVNGGTWQVLGSDNYNTLVGSPPYGVTLSEWSLAKPEAWGYFRPILAENGGWALFIWTPRGPNHATRAFEAREKTPDEWFTLRSGADVTGVFDEVALERELRELVDETGSREEAEARFRQEYMVDFNVATPGSYYGSHLSEAAAQGRIGFVPYDPAMRVYTSWDLGIDDYTAIWFFQQVGPEVRVIDYYETSGQGLPAIVKEAVASKPYLYAANHLPHDVMVRDLSTGRSRYETLQGLGLSNIIVGTATDPEERVNAVRNLLPMCRFDKERCAAGLDRLKAYRKRWIKSTSSYGGPLHDMNSHGSDAFGEFALNRRADTLRKKKGSGEGLNWMG
jgi:hypothetical protein